ncbi:MULTISPECIES: hypothetical protein [unclassified Rhizobium]|uniref:hypothetical protein n=1 Tax=unclassified Rhizobium TaxID=2613769 RepID=UPI0007135660|nr:MULTISPECIES: hypothetical protein [unclassified Rhizobium]KQS98080.1 hypothetical protein ASG50_23140 [Rhizobium sp. Leaf386]KQT00341.1 hypothetical protein ASG42_05730 [Rhizobium sp. Leaf391]KQT97344.1 hypothetical protein ASG68_10460 [Rhizobium sp. Leaf453]
MSIEFLATLGFSSDPFASTNAADEPLIGRYFVQPPFFPAVVGDPKSPKSNIVFAPRGGGKTAQKIMIEEKSRSQHDFLCITYDKFPNATSRSGTSEYHLENITRSLLIAALLMIENKEINKDDIPEHDRKLILILCQEMLGNISAEKFHESLASIKSVQDKFADI